MTLEDHVQTWTSLEAQFFRALNRFVEPAVRAGCGSPGIAPSGLIVLETTGRRTGRTYRTPVAATLFDECVFASTTRGGRSQWLKNLAATPEMRYWLAGQAYDADAIVFAPHGEPVDAGALPALLRPAAPVLSFLVNGLGAGFAVLTPRASRAIGAP
jgi:deazaflavin-dependent oxidoreductase (nitroreductase family)